MYGSSLPVSRGIDIPRSGAARPFRHRRSAFTIVELSVSIAVLTLLIALLSQALNQTSRVWRFGQANSESSQNMRALGDSIANELRSALLPLDRTMLSGSGFQFIVNPPGVTGSTYDNPDSVFWQAAVATDTSLGEAAEVGYFVQWDTVANPGDPNTNPQNPKATLCRFLVNPGTSGSANATYMIYSSPGAWLSNSLLQAVAPATSSQSYQGLFAENVIGLWVRCLDSTGQAITTTFTPPGAAFPNGELFDSRLGYTDSTGSNSAGYTNSLGQPAPLCALPSQVEISLVMLDSQSAAKVTPAIKSAIVSSIAGTVNGSSFVSAALTASATNGLRPISSGLRCYETRIYLQESK